jgi:type IV pilus assembly protein PilC
MRVALPLQTRALIALSQAISRYWPLIIGLPALAAVVSTAVVRHNAKARYLLDYLKLRLPLTGPILQKIILTRFASFLALMYQSGISLLDALKTCEEIVGNRVLADALQRAGQQISAGDGLTESFRNLGFFPPLVLRMLGVGESTGALDSALLNISYFYDREAKDSLEKALKLLEPALTVLLGLILGLIMYSVLMPLYDVLGKMPL